jgi:hypothetical protein
MQMEIKNALEWNAVSSKLRAQMQSAPPMCRKDLAKMIGRIEGLVHQLGSEEVEMRRCKKTTTPRHASLLERINQSITDFDQWLMLAHLQHG